MLRWRAERQVDMRCTYQSGCVRPGVGEERRASRPSGRGGKPQDDASHPATVTCI